MASVSFQIANTGDSIQTLSTGADTVAEGTAAPTTANDIEVRIDLAGGWNRATVRRALETLWRYLDDPGKSTSIPHS
jgi:hypothetical protein